MTASAAHRIRVPAAIYPETDRMGEPELQWFISKLFQEVIARWFAL